MVKGLFVGLAVVIVLAVIPVVHFVGIPAGPFIAGYFGINAATGSSGSPGRKALTFGVGMGVAVGVITVIAALIVTVAGDFAYPFLLWGGIVVVTFYYSSMSALGAWYAELRAQDRADRADRARTTTPQGSPVSGPRR